jgi:hypothetical protein
MTPMTLYIVVVVVIEGIRGARGARVEFTRYMEKLVTVTSRVTGCQLLRNPHHWRNIRIMLIETLIYVLMAFAFGYAIGWGRGTGKC